MKYQTKYEELIRKCAVSADLSGALALMGWDQETNMPKGASERRASQMATLAATIHEYNLKEIYPLVKDLASVWDELESVARLNVLELKRELDKAQKLPTEFVSLMTKTSSETQFAWEKAYKANNYAEFAPYLEKMFVLKKQEADYYGYTTSPYDALLDSYEQGLTSSMVTTVFEQMKPELKQIIEKVQQSEPISTDFLHQKIDKEKQWQFTMKVLEDMGFDFSRGRQDISTHPFTTSFSMEDVRVTTRVDEFDLSNALYSSIHEGGHALYEQGLLTTNYGLPSGQACSLAVHESQSRIWENNIGRSLPFIEYYFIDLQQLFPDNLKGKDPLQVFEAFNVVKPSFIRTSADEVTYHFHILTRFEVEREIMENRLKVKDLSEFWNAKMKEYLNLDVKEDNQGALQDVHWSMGAIGYFPTYSLGSFYAAQFFAKANQSIPDLNNQIKAGQFLHFKKWLNESIHVHGKLYPSEVLCQLVTGEQLNVNYFLSYIKEKLSVVYGWT